MNPKLNETLWSNSDRNRFFVLADDQKLPPGEFEIRTVTGRQQKVDITALEAYEISQEEAKTWLVAQFGQVMHKGKDALVGFFDRLRTQAQKPQTDQEKPKASITSMATTRISSFTQQGEVPAKTISVNSECFPAITIASGCIGWFTGCYNPC